MATSFVSLRKPPRILQRHGSAGKQQGDDKDFVGTAKCGETILVNSKSDKHERCPLECPYYVQDKTDDLSCTFVCVTADECSKYNPNAPVADSVRGACRAPKANFCKEYDHSGEDSCLVCKGAYFLGPDGQCHFKYMWVLWTLFALLIFVVVVLASWLVSLGCRAPVNQDICDEGLHCRSDTKLHQPPTDEDPERDFWSLRTNLLTTSVAGPGMLLHFNFQMVIIVWALGVGLAWTVISYIQDPAFDRYPDLMRLGTRKFGLPRENCILVAWGYETQLRLMWIKVWFLVALYFGTFALAIYHSIRQQRIFEDIDEQNSTMIDFAALLSNLPKLSGRENPEEEIKQHVKEVTGEEVVGVSIAWDFKMEEEKVMKAVKEDVYNSEELFRPEPPLELGRKMVQEMNWLSRKVYETESELFAEGEPEELSDKDQIVEFLNNMETTEFAFVVFETEASRNRAVKTMETKGSCLRDNHVKIEAACAEPDTVQWENFGHSDTWAIVRRIILGFGYIFLGLLAWTVCFYGPYAWSIYQFNYDNGQEPGFVYGFAFSMVVVIGNAIMYEICARVSDMVGFHFRDNREACYMILYTIACTFNVLLDFVSTYYIVWEMSKGLGFRTYHGKHFREIDSFTEQFETYGMQRMLGENTYTYAFPSTMLIPFLIEPIVTIYLPLKLGVLIVRTHPDITGVAAEEWLAAAPMELGRYADCLLDVVLAVLVLYFPGGYTWQLYFALGFCHMFIYAFDHWKVLRNIPACTYASMEVDWWSQIMLAPCIAIILSALIFKANCQDYGYCYKGFSLVAVCTIGFVVHCVVHIGILVYVIPHMSKRIVGQGAENTHFKDCAKKQACNWFTANPVHCLRSKYVFEHRPECMFFMYGKEHCQQVNEDIGCYFKGERSVGEDYDERNTIIDAVSICVQRDHKGRKKYAQAN